MEISSSATYDDIKKSYRQLALKYHPDRNSGNYESQKLFIKVNQAYKILSNEESRKRYDVTYRIRAKRNIHPTPQLFLDKFKSIRKFIFSKGKHKISQSALYKALNNLLSDSNIQYLVSKNNQTINEEIVQEALKCCNFLPFPEAEKIAERLMLLAGSNDKIKHIIYTSVENHKSLKSGIIIKTLATITHKVTTLFS